MEILGKVRRLLRKLPAPVKVSIKVVLSPYYFFRIVINDVRAYFGYVPGDSRIIFVAGYPKSGTTWVENFISNIPGYNPRVLGGDREVLRFHGLPPDAFDKIPKHGYSSIKTHINPNDENIDILVRNGVNKVLVMYRDPRDIVVSNYYHILKDNPWKPTDSFYADYSKMTKEDALSHSMDLMIDDFSSWIHGWKKCAEERQDIDCLVIKYEDLRNDPRGTFRKTLSFFGVELNKEQFDETFSASEKPLGGNFMTAFLPGKMSTKRKGTFGEWKKEFNANQKREFKEKAGSLLVELGYERDLDW